MQRARLFLSALLSFVCFLTTAQEEKFNPQTILVSKFTVTRPESWKWVDTETGRPDVIATVIFSIPDPGSNLSAEVFIAHFEPEKKHVATPAAVIQRWKNWFASAPDSASFGAPVVVGTNKVWYTQITGTFKGVGKSRPNYSLFGALVDDSNGNLVIRLVGPAALVEKAKPDFKKMIEGALKQE